MKQEISAGGVVYQKIADGYQFVIGKHSGYHKWVLPKGMVEAGETLEETAVREVAEEVGVRAKIVQPTPIKTIEYFYTADLDTVTGEGADGKVTERRVVKYAEDGGGKVKVHKKVVFYLLEVEEDLGKEGWEMEERKWVGYEEGRTLLTFETEREVWETAGRALGIA